MQDNNRLEWVEIVEPRSREFMYINLDTGECLWEPPTDSSFKKSNDSEWWELFDPGTARFYYYNARQQKTVWHRPNNCAIIPLAKLQTLKHRITDNSDKMDISTQTATTTTSTTTTTTNGSNNKKSTLQNGDKRHSSTDDSLDNLSTTSGTISEKSPLQKDSPVLPTAAAAAATKSTSSTNPSISIQSSVDSINSTRDSISGKDVFPPENNHAASSSISAKSFGRTKPDNVSGTGSKAEADRKGLTDDVMDVLTDLRRAATRVTPEPRWPPQNEFTANLARFPLSTNHHCLPAAHSATTSYLSGGTGRPERPVSMLQRDAVPYHGYAQEAGGSLAPGGEATAHVATFQITPTMRPRAFPRTNPAYVGTYRRDRPPLYKRVESTPNAFVYGNLVDFNKPLSSSFDQGTSSRRPNSDGAVAIQQRALAQQTGDAVFQQQLQRGTGQLQRSNVRCGALSSQDPTANSWIASVNRNDGIINPVPVPPHRPYSDGMAGQRMTVVSEVGQLSAPGSNDHCPSAPGRDCISFSEASDRSSIAPYHTRRKSEPDYVNVVSRNRRSIQTFVDERAIVESFGGGCDQVDSGACTRSTVLSCGAAGHSSSYLQDAIYMNQQELNLAARYSSRSTCNFMEPVSDGLPEFDFDDSDRSSVYSTPSPQSRQFQTLAPSSMASAACRNSAALATYHPSLRKKKWFERQTTVAARQSTLEKSWSLQAELTQQRPLSLMSPYSSESNVIANKVAGTLLQQMHIEQFVLENLNEHRKGILGKTMSISHMLSWTKDIIQKPMIRTANKVVKKMAPELFRIIQAYMGDRKAKETSLHMALEVAIRGWSIVDLRDEIFIQICRQTTKNPHEENAALGWELLGICLAFFPPSPKFYSYLDGHIHKNIDSYSHTSKSAIYQYATSCEKRLQWIVQVGAKRGLRKPNIDEVKQAKRSLIEPSMFGSTLIEVMHMQRDRYPERRLPWIQTSLSDEVLRRNGHQTEGIFRVPGDIDEVNALKVRCDSWQSPSLPPPHLRTDPDATSDPHVPASLLKLWYRELAEPLIPYSYYDRCVDAFANADEACAIVRLLPELHRLALTYLIHFLQGFIRPEVVRMTKMDVNNIAMVWAPNCLRSMSSDPKVIFENTRREMGFIRTLIQSLNTNEADGLV